MVVIKNVSNNIKTAIIKRAKKALRITNTRNSMHFVFGASAPATCSIREGFPWNFSFPELCLLWQIFGLIADDTNVWVPMPLNKLEY